MNVESFAFLEMGYENLHLMDLNSVFWILDLNINQLSDIDITFLSWHSIDQCAITEGVDSALQGLLLFRMGQYPPQEQ